MKRKGVITSIDARKRQGCITDENQQDISFRLAVTEDGYAVGSLVEFEIVLEEGQLAANITRLYKKPVFSKLCLNKTGSIPE